MAWTAPAPPAQIFFGTNALLALHKVLKHMLSILVHNWYWNSKWISKLCPALHSTGTTSAPKCTVTRSLAHLKLWTFITEAAHSLVSRAQKASRTPWTPQYDTKVCIEQHEGC